jgi:hypothetical protein
MRSAVEGNGGDVFPSKALLQIGVLDLTGVRLKLRQVRVPLDGVRVTMVIPNELTEE